MGLFRILGLTRRFDEGKHPRDAKGKFAPKGAGASGAASEVAEVAAKYPFRGPTFHKFVVSGKRAAAKKGWQSVSDNDTFVIATAPSGIKGMGKISLEASEGWGGSPGQSYVSAVIRQGNKSHRISTVFKGIPSPKQAAASLRREGTIWTPTASKPPSFRL